MRYQYYGAQCTKYIIFTVTEDVSFGKKNMCVQFQVRDTSLASKGSGCPMNRGMAGPRDGRRFGTEKYPFLGVQNFRSPSQLGTHTDSDYRPPLQNTVSALEKSDQLNVSADYTCRMLEKIR